MLYIYTILALLYEIFVRTIRKVNGWIRVFIWHCLFKRKSFQHILNIFQLHRWIFTNYWRAWLPCNFRLCCRFFLISLGENFHINDVETNFFLQLLTIIKCDMAQHKCCLQFALPWSLVCRTSNWYKSARVVYSTRVQIASDFTILMRYSCTTIFCIVFD